MLAPVPSAQTTRDARTVRRHRLSWSAAAAVGLVEAIVLLPFFVHRSAEPVFLTFSRDYIAFLLAMSLGAVGPATFLAFAVRRAPRERQAVWAIGVFVLLAGIVGVGELVLCFQGRDAFAWYRSWGHMRSPLVGFEPRPNHRWGLVHDHGRRSVSYGTDAQGFRVHLNARPRPEDELLVVAMGGSAVFGYGLNDDETWPHLLEDELRRRVSERVTVLNAGCNGHNTLQQLIRFHTRVRPLRPAMLIHYGAINDVRLDRDAGQLIPLPPALVEGFTAAQCLAQRNRGKGFYFEHSLLLDRASNVFQGWIRELRSPGAASGQEPAVDPPVAAFAVARDLYLQNLRTMDLLCQMDGTSFVPVLFLADRTRLPALYHIGIDALVQGLADVAEAESWPCVDLRDALEAEPRPASLFAADGYHPSRLGAEFLAGRMAEALEAQLSGHPRLADRLADQRGGR